jgi:hypothetical protein
MAYLPTPDNIGSMYVGDIPESPSDIFFHDEAGNPAATSHFTTLSTHLFSPAGVDLGALTTTVADGHGVHVAWPTTSKFTTAGLYSLHFTFTKTGGERVTAEPLRLVIQGLDGWLTLEGARSQWADAPLDDVFLAQILDAAKLQCVAYAPALAVGAVIPVNYLHAQLMQSRALLQSVLANQQDNVGVDGFQVRVFPLDFTIRALLRPKKAFGGMY